MTSTSSALRPLCSRAVALARCTTDPGAGPPVALSALARTRIGAAAPFGVPVRTSAAAPSPIGEHIGSVSGSVIIRLASTSSTVIVVAKLGDGVVDGVAAVLDDDARRSPPRSSRSARCARAPARRSCP